MKNTIRLFMVALQLCIVALANAQVNFWTDVSERSVQSSTQKRLIYTEKSRTVRLAEADVKQFLGKAPKEFTLATVASPSILSIPMPDGGFEDFAMVESPAMEPALAALFPEIKTYTGQSTTNPATTIKIDVTSYGFHAMILGTTEGAVFIDPVYRQSNGGYISYYKKDFKTSKTFTEGEGYFKQEKQKNLQQRTAAGPCIGGTLRTYRLAVACTGEYAQAVGATTVTQAMAAITTTINRVNGIYERDLDIRMVLVANNQKVVFINPATDKFTDNDDANVLIGESQKVITDSIGSANFDIGHTFSTGGGGLAGLGVVCRNSQKAQGITGSPSPVGDPFDIDYVAHEMGHQFGANHTFNGNTGNCTGNGSSTSNVEPGSGSTIMGYAGICGVNNLQINSDAYFHAKSLEEIRAYLNGTGGTCGTTSSTGNSAPVVNAGADFIIPTGTPFIVTGSATDPNGDALLYCWEQMDVGGTFGSATSPSGQAPLFRSFTPSSNNFRIFPRLSDILNNTSTMGELLPGYGRTINLRLTARDNKAGGGGVCSDDMLVTVAGGTGPFRVTAFNSFTTLQAGTFRTITWDVANTNQAPINCSQVNIMLSTDGGNTFPITLAANTPNDGSEEIKVPTNLTSQARIRVMAAGNIFFDLNNANLSVQNAGTAEFVFNSPAPVTSCSGNSPSVVLRTSGLAGYNTPITLSANNVPQGVTVSFSANPVTPGNDVTITLQGTVPNGNHIITINGTSGSIAKSQNLEFVVGSLSTAPTLASPADRTTGVGVTPTFSWSQVPGAASYTLQVATSAAFTTLVQSISNINNTSYTLTVPLQENTEYYWRALAANACGNGPAPSGNLFRTLATVCGSPTVSTDVPKTIAAPNANTVTSTINVSTNVLISDLNVVGLKGTHSYISDLTFKLKSPSNTEIVLFEEICDDEENFDLNLDDQATTSTFPCPPVAGVTIKPVEPLSAFNGQASQGTWTLSIIDSYTDDGGSLTGWGLRFCNSVVTPLPVNWLSFTAQKGTNSTVNLHWATANEVNNHFYEIERSTNGVNFTSIGKITGGNNLTMMQHYYFNDLKPYKGANFYRIKQTDVDGRYTYSAVARVSIETIGSLWTVFPNPARGQANIRLLANLEKADVTLTDATGRIVYRQYLDNAKAGQQLTLPLQGIAPGVYILKIDTNGHSNAGKLVVK